MRTPLAWLNTLEHPWRTAAAVGGVSFALLLIFMQAGFLAGARTNAAIIHSSLDCDLVLHSRAYLTLPQNSRFERFRLAQASTVPGVAGVSRLSLAYAQWRHAATGATAGCFVLGVPALQSVFLDPVAQSLLPLLPTGPTALVDRRSRASYGPWQVGGACTIDGQSLAIAGEFSLGTGVLADGCVIVDESTFGRLFGPATTDRANLGLVKLAPGADPAAVAVELARVLPRDVTVATKADLMRREGDFYVNVKPAGLLFQVGMIVAFAAGAAILCQILAAEMTNRVREFATLKALGFGSRKIYAVGLGQGLLYVLLAYLPAFALALGVYAAARRFAGFPVQMEAARALFVFALALAMCALAAAFSLGKIRRADPAALFGR